LLAPKHWKRYVNGDKFLFVRFSAISKIEIKTLDQFTADMDTGGQIRVYIANAYGNGCSTPYYSGPSNFQRGDVFRTGYCNGFIMPKKVKIFKKIID
jgi:hypothetical protein